jgi:hypothetical protein
VPINNVYLLIDFLKKYLFRIYTENGLELFTEEISVDTIELLKSKGATLKSLESKGEREKVLTKLQISDEEKDTINQYYEGLPKFNIGECKAFVKGHSNVEAGDITLVDVRINLENHESQLVADNMLRESFNYPGQEDRILKIPYFYVFLMEKGGKIINFEKVPFKNFAKTPESNEIKDHIMVRTKVVFSSHGSKKLTIKVINDTYIGIEKDLEKDITGKLTPTT